MITVPFCALTVVLVLALNMSACSNSDGAVAWSPPAATETHGPEAGNPWTDDDLSAAVGAPGALPGSLTGYVLEANHSQHVYYVDAAQQHIRTFWWDLDGWHLGDVTAAANAVPAEPGSLTGIASETANSQHLFYAGAGGGQVHELRWTADGWQQDNLTASAGAPPSGSTLTGYSIEEQQSHHVFYLRRSDNHVQQLWWDSERWHTQDLSAAVLSPPGLDGAMVSYVDVAQGIQHVFYVGTDSHLYELWSDQDGWHLTDLTAVTGTPAPVPATLAGYMFDAQGTQHVYFVGIDGKLYELFSQPDGWQRSDLSSQTGAPTPAKNPLAAYAFEAQQTQHVVYQGADGQLYELWWDSSGWQVGNLTAGLGAPKPAPGRMFGYAFETQKTQHIMYVTADGGSVHELWSGNPEG
ncbi:MAG: hypothetical protein WA944_19830 [Mycobacterium sp.]